MFDLARYRARIRDEGPLAADLPTLRRLHRNHLYNVPFENLDVVRGIPVPLDPQAAFEKIVARRRGGWCYEMNGLFATALRAAGFEVDLAGASVGERAESIGQLNHLTLLVHLADGSWLADVGFGSGPPEPLALHEGPTAFGPFTFRLDREAEGWRFHTHEHGGLGYAFTTRPRALEEFQNACAWMQSDPESSFTGNAAALRALPGRYLALRGKVLTAYTGGAPQQECVAADLAEYETLLRDRFDLDLDVGEATWRKIEAAHAVWEAEDL